jgi:hypothetical protein
MLNARGPRGRWSRWAWRVAGLPLATCGVSALGSCIPSTAQSSAIAGVDPTQSPAPQSGPASGAAAPVAVAPEALAGARKTQRPEQARAEQILARADLAAYHGWVRYLQFRAAHAAERFPQKPDLIEDDRRRFADWTQRILDNPKLVSELRGVTEWAYLSPVDGSGQPFKLNIPTDYDPSKPAPLVLYMHGYSGNHLEHSVGMVDHPGFFEVSVLGRSRGGRYRALSEADVLAVLAYVAEHWAVDPDRVHLTGGSMGGAGTFWLGSRYPDRFASGRPVCGAATDKPLGNLLTLPLYATHSDDDWRVPILHSRGPIAKLRALGANATLDETTGLGHAAWDYGAGNERGAAWYVKQVRPASKDVTRLDFTALDGGAMGEFWAQIAEWGPKPAPARFALKVTGKNHLEGKLENIARLRLVVAQAPLDASQPLVLRLAGASPLSLPAPLPDAIFIERTSSGWAFAREAPPVTARRHTPGGANQLYDGEPLLIVYGTRGSSALTAALRAAAEVASHNSNASWPPPNGERGNDGVSHNQNLYGDLLIKADSEVTADDIARRHLVLIGSAAQNRIVEKLSARLPVHYDHAKIVFDDGSELPAEGRALGLVHYNPEAPDRLLFWIAADDPAAYAAGSLVPELLGAPLSYADAVVVRISDPALVLTRSFDSSWHWVPRDGSTPLPEELGTSAALAAAVARSVRRAAPAEFALAGLPRPTHVNAYEPGNARLADLLVQYPFEPITVMTLHGSELSAAAQAVAASGAHLEPEADLAHIKPRHEYRLALSAQQISPFVALTHLAPRKYAVTDTTLLDALERYGLSAIAAPRSATKPSPASVATRSKH